VTTVLPEAHEPISKIPMITGKEEEEKKPEEGKKKEKKKKEKKPKAAKGTTAE
jgi:hypothetical protein